jgi:TRAP-type C4-dicarboxylate transport system permease small subunit
MRLATLIDVLDGAVGRAISAISGVGAGIGLVVMTALVVVGIVSRSVFNISLPFTIEYSEYLIPVVGLVGAAHALRHGDHVRADLALHRLPPTARGWLIIAGYLVGLGYLIVLIVVTFTTAFSSIERGYTSIYPSATLYGYWQLVVPLGLLLFALQLVILILKETKDLLEGQPPG